MNIFVTSACPKECAKFLDNKRVVKMCLETAQMLCTTLNLQGVTTPYKTTHKNHPCTLWVRSSTTNYNWAVKHFKALCDEYNRRYGKHHACSALLPLFESHVTPSDDPKDFVNCTTHPDLPVFDAYKRLLQDKWVTDKRKPEWT